MLVAPAIVALRLSRKELAAELEGVTDEVERDRVTAKFADFSSNTAGNLMCGCNPLRASIARGCHRLMFGPSSTGRGP